MHEHKKSAPAHSLLATPPAGVRETVDAFPDVLFCCDESGRWVWLNAAIEPLTGFKPRDLVGQMCTAIVTPSGRRRVLRHLLPLIPPRAVRRGAMSAEGVVPPGRSRPVEFTFHVMTARDQADVTVRLRRVTDTKGTSHFVGIMREASDEPRDDSEKPVDLSAGMGTPGSVSAATATAPARPESANAPGGSAGDVAAIASAPPPAASAPPAAVPVVPAAPAASGPVQERVAETPAPGRDSDAERMEMLATMTHEMRTPMNGIMGTTHLLLETPLDDRQREMVDVIRTSSRALLTLINDTLDFSKLGVGRVEIEEIDFDIRVMVEQVGALLRTLATEKGITLECRVQPEVPSLVRGDPSRLRQVLINLGGNAVKFTERGGVTIRVERADESDTSVNLRFMVVDTGIGIAESKLPGLFRAFEQGDPSIARRFGGTGLGLAVTRRLVELMGGQVGVESSAGSGSTFWFTSALTKQPEATVPKDQPPVELTGLRVLVADHSQVMRSRLRGQLSAWGCRVECAGGGEESLSMLRAAVAEGDAIQVALVDLDLPDMSGEELGLKIRSDATLAATRLLLQTSVGHKGDGARVHAQGFSAYLIKPVPFDQLRVAMVTVMRMTPSACGTPTAPLVTRHSIAEAQRSQMRILLVEDNPVNQLVTKWALRRHGYALEVAENGMEALGRVSEARYDLIFMDIHMPDMDGYEAVRRIRKMEGDGPRTPIVAMTANSPDGELQRCRAAGMDDLLSKPVDLAALSETVERYAGARLEMADPRPDAAPDRLESPAMPDAAAMVETVTTEAAATTGLPASEAAAVREPAAMPEAATLSEPAMTPLAAMPAMPAMPEAAAMPAMPGAIVLPAARAEVHEPAAAANPAMTPGAPATSQPVADAAHDAFAPDLPIASRSTEPVRESAREASPDREAPSAFTPDVDFERGSESGAEMRARVQRSADAGGSGSHEGGGGSEAGPERLSLDRFAAAAASDGFRTSEDVDTRFFATGGVEQDEPPTAAAALRPEPGPAQEPPIDLVQLEESSMGIAALREALLQAFMTDIGPRMERMSESIGSADGSRLEFEAHGLKGMSATIGATGCARAFAELERMGRENRLLPAPEWLGRARTEVERARRFILDQGGLSKAA